MEVFNNNYKEVFEVFKETCDKAKFVAFDCEMSGLILEPKTDGGKYDTQEFRYYKQKRVEEKFDLIQLGFTFYIEQIHKSKNEDNKEQKQDITKLQYYLERTFTFNLLKNPGIILPEENIFYSKPMYNPAAAVFLSKNNFDFNKLVSKGIHYNKLSKVEKIREALTKEKIPLMNSSIFLSKDNENCLIENIIKITEFLIESEIEESNKNRKPILLLKFNNKRTLNFLLGCNLKNLIFLENFNIQKSKSDERTLEIKKIKPPSLELFNQKYISLDNFKSFIKNHPENIYLSRSSQRIFNNKEIEEKIQDELGFSIFIKYLSEKQIPIIGHNLYYDIMFLYDKFIDDLPEDFYTYKEKVHKYFPKMFDTKTIATSLGKYDKTGLEPLYKILCKNKYNSYVSFEADSEKGFDIVDEEKSFHDSGFDSIITGRCFVLMNKALENNYHTEYSRLDFKSNKFKKGTSKTNNIEKKLDIKYGYINLSLFDEFLNVSHTRLVDSPFAKIIWDVNKQTREEYNKQEENLINIEFKGVFFVNFKKPEDSCSIPIYEIGNIFKNPDYDIFVLKYDYFSAFIEFSGEDYQKEKDLPKITKIIEQVKEKKESNEKNVLKVDSIYSSQQFFKNFRNIIKLN